MLELGLEVIFWLSLLIYISARVTKTKKIFKQEY